MSRVWEALAAWLASALYEPEREAVLGDLAESGEGGWQAVLEIFGLVIRRQAGAWKDFDLWLSVVTLVVPLTFLLSAVSRSVIGEGAVYTWMYVNNSDWKLAGSAGFWYVLREAALGLSTNCVLLASCSFSAGFVLGRLPKQFVPTCRTALVVLLALSQAPAVRSLSGLNAPVTANMFYRVFFPWIVVATLIVPPALLGTKHGQRPELGSNKLRVFLLTAAIVPLITMLLMLPGLLFCFGDAGRQWFFTQQQRDTNSAHSRLLAHASHGWGLDCASIGGRGRQQCSLKPPSQENASCE